MRRLPGRRDDLPPDVVEQVEFELKYRATSNANSARSTRSDQTARQRIPDHLDYHAIGALRL
jgi:tRNA U34 5-carboxymethylaminomethyl modifying enzyme MnmG/GidA